MIRTFRNLFLPVLLITVLVASGCACRKDFKKSYMLKGAIIGIIPGAVIGGETSDDDDSDEIAAGIIGGAIIGGLIGSFFDKCEPEAVQVAQAPVDEDSDGDGVVDRLDQCPDTPRGVPTDYKGCPKDSDGDGVYDNMDKCPNTPQGVKVDSAGCPSDSDSDGVYDYQDKCPGTPAGVKVDYKGCPVDTDKDGVADYQDECPGTPLGAKADSRGCWVLKGVYFDTGKSNIKPESYPVLDEVVDVLKKNSDLKIEVQGHTDSVGSASSNQALSEKRAKSVMEYFNKNGAKSSQLSYKGYGEDVPIDTNDTPEGRSKNRRVELKPVI